MPVKFYGQGLLVIAPSVTHFTLHVHIGHEIHFDAALSVALAGFAASAGYVEAEPPRLVAAFARLRQHGKQIADRRKDLRVGCGIRTWRAPDWRLVDADDFVDVFGAREFVMCTRLFA